MDEVEIEVPFIKVFFFKFEFTLNQFKLNLNLKTTNKRNFYFYLKVSPIYRWPTSAGLLLIASSREHLHLFKFYFKTTQ